MTTWAPGAASATRSAMSGTARPTLPPGGSSSKEGEWSARQGDTVAAARGAEAG
ncbi:MAG TPA: hypothetical protein VHJ17_24845 [Thermomonospora sp.]|nr:hypothetical protein [Thermomonospora sp.]